MDYEPIIGLEIHVELATKSKMFCGCPADHFGRQPNTQTCPVCLGLPGALPVPNRRAVEWTLMLGLALNCEIPQLSKFDRKNYFYPDLPKGYQISQYDQPLARNGWLEIQNPKSKIQKIRIRRVHLEEDTGKLLHATVEGKKVTLIDFNRSGVPLVEIVTEPDIESAEEAKFFLKKLHQIVRYLAISDADMEKGSMRIEPNVSIQVQSSKFKVQSGKLPNYKVEVKNINSFRFAERAIKYEIERQIEILERGETPRQETRGWDEVKNITVAQRLKEEAMDYRYFPEPDIPPMRFASAQISKLKAQIGELPEAKLNRFVKQYGLGVYEASLLTETADLAHYFEEAVKVAGNLGKSLPAKAIANWLINKQVDLSQVFPAQLVSQIKEATAVATISEADLENAVKQVIAQNSPAVSDYKKGRQQALMFLAGQVRKKLGNIDVPKAIEILKKLLS